MTKKTLLLTAGFSILTLAGTALAEPNLADTNQDGQITHTEFMAQAEAKFTATDLNQDGYVSEDERQQAREQRMNDRRAEFFAKADANGDGAISQEEHATMAAERGPRHERKGERGKRSERRDKSQSDRHTDRKAEIDVNGDGLLSYQEFMAGAEQKFASADQNGDGILADDEIRRGKKKPRRSR